MSKNKENKFTLFDLVVIALFVLAAWYFIDKDSFLKTFSSKKTEDKIVEKEEKVEKTRTILIYMSPGNLESDGGHATKELNALDKDKFDFEHNNFLVLAGGTKKWYNDFSLNPKIYRFNEEGEYEVVDNCVGYTNMGDSKTLSHFLSFAKDNYESDEYIVYLFGHGYGIDGLLPDEFTNDNLRLPELSLGFYDSSFGNNEKIDLFIANSCLMGTIETLSFMSNHSKYAITSEELGWAMYNYPLFKVFNDLTPDKDIVTFSKEYIDSYKESVSSIRTDTTLALVDLSEAKKLLDCVHKLFGSIDLNQYYSKIYSYRGTVTPLDKDYILDEVDLKTVVNHISTLDSRYNKYKDEYVEQEKKTILYNYSNNYNLNGISIWFPYYNPKIKDNYILEGEYIGNEYLYFPGTGYYNFVTEFIKKQKEEYGII